MAFNVRSWVKFGACNYCYVNSAFLNILSYTKRFQMTFCIVLQGCVLNFNAKGWAAEDSDLLGRAIDGDDVKSKKSTLKRNSLVTPHFTLASYAKVKHNKNFISILPFWSNHLSSLHIGFHLQKKKKSLHIVELFTFCTYSPLLGRKTRNNELNLQVIQILLHKLVFKLKKIFIIK